MGNVRKDNRYNASYYIFSSLKDANKFRYLFFLTQLLGAKALDYAEFLSYK